MQATRIFPPVSLNFDFIRNTFVPFRRVTKLHPDSTTCSHSIRCLHLFTNLHPAWPSFIRICRAVNPTSRQEAERESCILDSIMNRIALSRSSFNWIPVWTMWHDYITIRREFVERLRRAEGTKSNKSSNIVPVPMDKFRPSTRWQRNPSVDGKRNMETSSHWTSNYRT